MKEENDHSVFFLFLFPLFMPLSRTQQAQLRALRITLSRLQSQGERLAEDAAEKRTEASAAMEAGNSDLCRMHTTMMVSYQNQAKQYNDLAMKLSLLQGRLRLVYEVASVTASVQSTLNSVCTGLTQNGKVNLAEMTTNMDSLTNTLETVEKANQEVLTKLAGSAAAELAPDDEVAQAMAQMADEHALSLGASLPTAVQEVRRQRNEDYAAQVADQLPTVPDTLPSGH